MTTRTALKTLSKLSTATFKLQQKHLDATRAGKAEEAASIKEVLDRTTRQADELAARLGW